MKRSKPAQRRDGINETLRAGGVTAQATVNFYGMTNKPSEIFLVGPKPGSPLALILEDCAVIISLALQYGVPPAMLGKSIARSERTLRPATVIGAALDMVCRAGESRKESPKLCASDQELSRQREAEGEDQLGSA